MTRQATDLKDLASEEERAEQHSRLERKTVREDTRWLMRTRQGRRVAARILERGGIYRSVFNTNALAMAFAEGNRNAAVMLLNDIIEAAPEEYLTLLKEQEANVD